MRAAASLVLTLAVSGCAAALLARPAPIEISSPPVPNPPPATKVLDKTDQKLDAIERAVKDLRDAIQPQNNQGDEP
jgi:hypothetical protein